MKASELRIGNNIQRNSNYKGPIGVFTVTGLSINSIDTNYTDDFLIDDNFEGIPLTDEWLLKFGFYLNAGHYFKEFIQNRGIAIDGIRVTLHEESGFQFLCNLEYVHQLQNLYFALTGEELITPKP